MSNYLDKRLKGLQPYVPGEQLRGRKIIKLNTNESPFPPAPGVRTAVEREIDSLSLYPDISGGSLMTGLAAWLGVGRENVFAGNGSDEILAFLFQGFCPNGAVFADLTYGFYSVYAELYHVDTEIIPLKEDFTIDVKDYANAGRTIFIANPNAPTGIALSRNEVEEIVKSNRDTLVVIDEAYVHFGAESCVSLLEKYDNLMVVGTFSKSRSLAGARLGYAVSSRELIADLERIKFSFNPYNINQMTMAAGTASLSDQDYFDECCVKIADIRSNCISELQSLGFVCTNSSANFVFVRHQARQAQELYLALKEQNILVRWFNKPRIDNYLRISIGSDRDMAVLVEALKVILQVKA